MNGLCIDSLVSEVKMNPKDPPWGSVPCRVCSSWWSHCPPQGSVLDCCIRGTQRLQYKEQHFLSSTWQNLWQRDRFVWYMKEILISLVHDIEKPGTTASQLIQCMSSLTTYKSNKPLLHIHGCNFLLFWCVGSEVTPWPCKGWLGGHTKETLTQWWVILKHSNNYLTPLLGTINYNLSMFRYLQNKEGTPSFHSIPLNTWSKRERLASFTKMSTFRGYLFCNFFIYKNIYTMT